jgi:hypothetical protein
LPITALSLSKGTLVQTPFVKSKVTSQGRSPVISANGITAGILWTVGQLLIAYDATTLAKLYSSAQAPDNRDAIPAVPHFANVVVANGKVYVGTNTSLVVFGLL